MFNLTYAETVELRQTWNKELTYLCICPAFIVDPFTYKFSGNIYKGKKRQIAQFKKAIAARIAIITQMFAFLIQTTNFNWGIKSRLQEYASPKRLSFHRARPLPLDFHYKCELHMSYILFFFF